MELELLTKFIKNMIEHVNYFMNFINLVLDLKLYSFYNVSLQKIIKRRGVL
jgi:hypothetical protein